MSLSETLSERGFVYQHTGDSLVSIVDGDKRTVYLGIDPTADSIHVGNLAVYMMLRHFVADGHKVILLVGGGTGLIGDPKATEERPLADQEEIAQRVEKIKSQVAHLVGDNVEVVNNADWLTKINLIEFLRDIGKCFTVNALVKKEIMRERLENEKPLSFTEFSYPLLQAYDYMHLFEERGVDVQVGGSDQWTNMTAGVELIHKKLGKEVHAMTVPLVVDKTTGKKFGKSEGNAVWLDSEKTSTFEFYQFWLNVDDANSESYLKIFTSLSLDEIQNLMDEHSKDPSKRIPQCSLAMSVTTMIHGEETARKVREASDLIFSDTGLSDISDEKRDLLRSAASTCSAKVGDTLLDTLVCTKLASSKREARQFIEDGCVTINGNKIGDVDYVLSDEDFQNGLALVRRGKRNVALLVSK